MKPQQRQIEITEDVPLAGHTTIGLGGRARYFARCQTIQQLREGLLYAQEQGLPVQVLGGGSNIIFQDAGFHGLVLKIDLRGVTFDADGDGVSVTAGAGEAWDELVQTCILKHLAGVECLSGIPGSAGATPIQNVGAYGQQVSDTVLSVQALDRATLKAVTFAGAECQFGYRHSRFKARDRDRYVITAVTYRLQQFGRPRLRYPELLRHVESQVDLSALESGRPALEAVRSAVLALRRRKSMLADPDDPDARSVGSFFINPVLSPEAFQRLQERWAAGGGEAPIPTFDAQGGIKVPAAWLVERAGFPKGYRHSGAGISSKHALALVNRGGTASDVLELAAHIQRGVDEKFGVRLEIEPVVVGVRSVVL